MSINTPIDNTHWLDPISVSAHLLWLRREIDTTPMQLIKLVYISHGWSLGILDQELLNEPVEAWTYGPVVPSVYHEFKRFGGYPISVVPRDMTPDLTRGQRSIMDAIHDVYMNCSGSRLSALTHKKGTPWHAIFNKYGSGSVIPSPLIREHYRETLGIG